VMLGVFCVCFDFYFFFFSSRRRHTRFSRDWSSDVCSSDLWERAIAHGEQLMAREAERGGFDVYRPEALSLAPYANAIGYYARTSLDEPSENGSTVVWFDQVSGAQLGFGKPYGSTAADAIDKTVRVLHTADGLGWPYRVFVSLFGLLTAGMAIAGVVLWVRRSRRLPKVVPALS